jgi:hypothetical protein
MPTEQIISRIRRALLLDQTVFEEVRDDAAFTPFALGAAAIAAIIGAIGAYLWGVIVLDSTPDGFFVDSVILGSLFLIILWVMGIAVTYLLLSQVYREEIAPDALARVIAIGHVPFALSLLVFIPQIGFGFGVLAVAAMFFYTMFGLRAAFPVIDPLRVMLSVAAGFAVWLMILPLLTSAGDAFAPGVFIFEWAGDVVNDLTGAFAQLTDFLPGS